MGQELNIQRLTVLEKDISFYMRGALRNMLEVGRCLSEAKESKLVSHGEWGSWVRKHTGFSERTAQKLMQAAREVPPGSAMEQLPITQVQMILSLPEPEREAVAEKTLEENTSTRALQEEIAAIKRQAAAELEAAHMEAEEALAQKELAREKLLEELAQVKAEARQQAGTGAINPEIQDRIDQLLARVEEAEEYAAQQSDKNVELRRQLQAAKAEGMREDVLHGGEGGAGLSVGELTAAVQAFIGKVGILPHMGMVLRGTTDRERLQYQLNIDRVAKWTGEANRAMQEVMADYEIAE